MSQVTSAYQPSGKMPLQAYLLTFVGGLITAIPAAILLVVTQRMLRLFLDWSLSFGIFALIKSIVTILLMVIVAPGLAGVVVGLGAGVGAQRGKAQNVGRAAAIGSLASLTIFALILLGPVILARVGWLSSSASLDELMRGFSLVATSHPIMFLVLAVEVVCAVLGGWVATEVLTRKPFCEEYDQLMETTTARVDLQENDYILKYAQSMGLKELETLSTSWKDKGELLSVELHHCSKCHNAYLDISISGRQGEKIQTELVYSGKLKTTPEDVRAFTAGA
jgi:hypothetical protein